MQKINDVANPVVGETYLVTCIKDNFGLAYFADGWIPFLGVPHNDSKYGFGDFAHIHYDYRFVTDEAIKSLMKEYNAEPDDEYDDKVRPSPLLMAHEVARNGVIDAWWVPRVMLRKALSFPVSSCGFMLVALQPAFEDKRIDPGRPVCPHRQVCLLGAAKDKGALVCPAHGLRWNAKTGKMAKRHSCHHAGRQSTTEGRAPTLHMRGIA